MGAAGLIAEVAVPVPVPRTFHYRVPAELDSQVVPGVRVRVPFGPRSVVAYCVGRPATSEFDQLKNVQGVLDPEPLIDVPMLELGRWMAGYYRASLGEVLEAVLPAGVRKASAASKQHKVVRLLSRPEFVDEVITGLKVKRATAQVAILEALSAREGREAPLSELRGTSKSATAAVNALEKRGLVAVDVRDTPVAGLLERAGDTSPPPALTAAQAAALDAIRAKLDADALGVVVLHDVTGSGKNEVYLRAIADVAERAQQAILLVPEISLTPQTVGRIAGRFPKLAVLHSHLAEAERRREWERIRAGMVDVVVGARSAIFAPVPNLGCILVDEEHEPTYKQDSAPRYHARDVAIMRCRAVQATVVLGSATPSLESYRNALEHRYELCSLPDRVAGGALPPVEIVDLMRDWDETGGVRSLSRQLRAALDETLARGEQAILFLNRRGFATALRCPKCGFVIRCKACELALTYHRSTDKALCHYCGEIQAPPRECPECRHPKVKFLGSGTQRLEDEIAAAFPSARLTRMDSDSMRKAGAYEATLGAVRRGDVDILIGTQMIAKGHDIPTVTLVGVIFADTGLHLPDFRSAERTFQIVAQVAGRAGRGEKPGRVIVQTMTPDHYSIQCAAEHDFPGFSKEEMEHRRALRYPPYSRLCRLLFAGEKETAVKQRAEQVAKALEADTIHHGGELLGPAPCPLARLNNKFRFHLLIKAPTTGAVARCLAPLDAPNMQRKARGVQMTVDVDPVSLL
jgi:primosomal protein N' (replication factor Y)